MGSEWKSYSLYEIVNIGSSKRVKMSDYVTNGVPFFRSKEVIEKNKGNDVSTELFITEEQFNLIEQKYGAPKEFDILLTSVGTIGVPYQVEKGDRFYFKDGNLTWFKSFREFVNPRYFYFWLTSSIAKRRIKEVTIGSTQQALTISALKGLDIYLPTLPIQNVIVGHLEAITRKISLNRKINQTLEQMAQALFKSWFVDFDPVIDNALDAGFFDAAINSELDSLPPALIARAELRKIARASDDFQALPDDIRQLFPSAFEDSQELSVGVNGWVPMGWEASSVIDLIQLVGGGTPKTSIDEYWNGDIPWFSVVDAPSESNIHVIDTEKHVTDLGVNNSSTKVLRKGTTIISARGTVGKCAFVARPMAMNQSCYGIQGVDGVTDEFTYYLIRHSVSQLQQRSHGSVFSTITRDTFKSLGFAFGGAKLTTLFSDYVTPMFEKVLSNNLENIELEKIRDTLLPKLISGELRLDSPEVEQAKALVDAEYPQLP